MKKTLIEKINSAMDANLILWDAEGHQHRIDLEDLQAMAIGLDVCRTYHTLIEAEYSGEKHVFKLGARSGLGQSHLCIRCGSEQYDTDKHFTYEEARSRRSNIY